MSTLRAANVEFDSTSTVKIGYNQDGVVRITSTGALKLPLGGVATRPSGAEAGLFRYNTDTASLEYRNASTWIRLETKTISSAFPSGGLDGDIWFKI